MSLDLVLWRHAEAQDWGEGCNDMERVLTSRGEKQAARMAAWLDRQLPEGTRILVSPARRAEQTAMALGRKYKLRPELAPDGSVAQLLELVQWPQGKGTAQLLGMQASECAIRKGAVWWLRYRERDGEAQTVLLSVQSPEVL
jgi:phosphohistidine phosphatase